MKIWASQGDIPTSFPSSTQFHLWAQLLAACRAATGCAGTLSLRKGSSKALPGLPVLPVAFPGTTVPIRRYLFSVVTLKTSSVSHLIQIYPSSAFIPLPASLHWSDHSTVYVVGQDFFLRVFFCRNLSVGVAMHPRLSLFGCVLLVHRAAELEFVLRPCPGCSRSLRTWSSWSRYPMKEIPGDFSLCTLNQVVIKQS